jgi:hypothetical protein
MDVVEPEDLSVHQNRMRVSVSFDDMHVAGHGYVARG